jgi:hypothetical protein
MTSIDVTDWALAKIEGYLTAIKSDEQAGVEISLIVHSDGERQMTMSLSDERSSDYVAHQCQVCDAITVSKVLPIPDLPGLNAPKTLDVGDETDDDPNRTHEHHDRRNGNGRNGQH